MNKIKFASVAAIIAAFAPVTVSAYETPIENNEVSIETIVEHFSGESNMERDEDGRYYNEYIFNGHIIQIYSGQTTAWVDGEAVPFLIEESDGVLLPKPHKMKNTFDNPTLPVEFFVNNFDYEINGDTLIFDELPEIEVEEEVEELEPVVEVSDVPEEPFQEEDSSGDETNREEVPNEPIQEPTPEEEIKEEEKQPEQPEEPAIEPKEVGSVSLSLDVMDYGLKNSETTGMKGSISNDNFVAYFENEGNIAVKWLNEKQTKTILAEPGSHNIEFPINEEEFYVVTIEVKDSRVNGLKTETVIHYVKKVDSNIVIHSGNNSVKLTYSNEDVNVLKDTFARLEKTLSFLGIEQFQLDETQENTFIVDFHLHDSSWSV